MAPSADRKALWPPPGSARLDSRRRVDAILPSPPRKIIPRHRSFADHANTLAVGARHAVPLHARLARRLRIAHRMIVLADAGVLGACMMPQRARHAVPLLPNVRLRCS